MCGCQLGLKSLVDIIDNVDKKKIQNILMLSSSRSIPYDLMQELAILRFDQRGAVEQQKLTAVRKWCLHELFSSVLQ